MWISGVVEVGPNLTLLALKPQTEEFWCVVSEFSVACILRTDVKPRVFRLASVLSSVVHLFSKKSDPDCQNGFEAQVLTSETGQPQTAWNAAPFWANRPTAYVLVHMGGPHRERNWDPEPRQRWSGGGQCRWVRDLWG